MSVYKKLSDAREQFHKAKLKKTGHNKFAGYYYFELGDFLVPALEVFKNNGLLSVITFGSELATMKVIDIDKPESFIEITSPMAKAQLKGAHDIQNLGAVETYTRRYLWVAALEIVEHDAIDSSAPVGSNKEPKLKLAALDGIGDDLPDEAKEAIKDLAAEATELVANNDAAGALEVIRNFGLEGDERLYLDRQLPSNVRSALRKVSQQQKAA